MKVITAVSLLFLSAGFSSEAVDTEPTVVIQLEQDSIADKRADEEVGQVWSEVEDNVQRGTVAGLARYLAPQVYLDLPGRDGGYYSANQARSIMQEFFRLRRVLHFKLSSKGTTHETPFATGGGTFINHGNRSAFQVYVSLSFLEKHWVISQFNVY